jgi:hypothetical protein
MKKIHHEIKIEHKLFCKTCGYITTVVNPLVAILIKHEHEHTAEE